MGGTAKKPTVGIPSAKALRGGRETSKKKLDLEPLVSDFNLLVLAAEANKSQMDKIVSDRLKEKGPKPSTDPKENPTELRRKIAENFFAEVLYYRDIQKYKATITPEFIQLFNPEDQLFLRKMVQELESYLADHEQYIAKLLPLFGYEDIDAFVDDLTQVGEAGEAINRANRQSISRAVVMDEIIEEEGFFSKIAKALSAKKEVPAKKVETPIEEDDRFSKLVKVAGATKESIAKHLADKLDEEKAAIFFEMARDHMQASAEANAHLFAYACAFNELLIHYANSSLAEDAQRQKECSQRKSGAGHKSSDLAETVRTMVLNRRVLPFNDIANLINETWISPVGEKVSAVVQDFRVAVAKNAEQLTEVKRVVDDTVTAIETARLLRIEESKLLNQLSKITSKATETAAANINKAAEVASTKLKSVVEAIKKGPFSGAPSDFCAEASYVNYVSRAWDVIQVFQSVKSGDPSTEGWKLVRKRSNGAHEEQIPGKKISKRFHKGDPALIYQNEELVCTVTPQKLDSDAENKFSGVGVEMHRHQKKDMALAINIMAASLRTSLKEKKEKKICITLDLKLPGADKLALEYAAAILSQCITPRLCDGSKELSEKETKAKLMELVAVMNAKGNHDYDKLVEQYKAHLGAIAIAKKEDAAFFSGEFKQFLEESSELDMQHPAEKSLLDKRNRMISKIAGAFGNRNLTTQEFVDHIVNCAQKMSPSRGALLTARELNELKENMGIYIDDCIAKELVEFKKEKFEEYVAKEIYNMAAGALEPEIDFTKHSDYFFASALQPAAQDSKPELSSEEKVAADVVASQPAPELSSEDKDKFLAAIDSVVQKIESSPESIATPKFNSSLLDKIKEGVPLNHVSQEEIDQLKRAKENKKSENPLVEELGKRRMGVAGDDNEDSSDWDDVDEDKSIAQKRAKYAVQKILSQKAHFEPSPKDTSNNAANLVGVYSVTENDISEFNLPEPAAEFKGLVQETEKISAERFDLSQKARSAPKDNGAPTVSAAAAPKAATAAAMSQNSREKMLRQLREGQSSLKPATVQPKPNADKPQGMFDALAKKIAEKKNQAFLQQFDALLQEYKDSNDSKEHHGITMQDPDTGEQLDELAILTRLAEIIEKGMTPEAFIDRAITFGLITLMPSAQAAVTDQDMNDLKKELREKVRLHLLHPAAERDEGLFAAHLIEFAQKELISDESKAKALSGRNGFISGATCAASVKQEDKAVSPQDVPVPGHC